MDEVLGAGKDGLLQEILYVPKSDSGSTEDSKLENEKKTRSDTLFLYFTILIGLLPLVVGGSHAVWLSSTYASLVSNDSDKNPLHEPASTADISMIGGLPVLIALSGPLFLTKLSDKIGRKLFLHITTLGMFVCNLALVFPTQAIHIILVRCVFFSLLTAYSVIIQVYISEICESHNKAKYFCVMGLCLPLGNMYGYYLGPIFCYRMYTNILAIPMIPFLVFFFLVPESPVYLLSRGKEEECLNSLARLRSNKSSRELKIDLDQLDESLKATKSTNDKSVFHLFKTRERKIAVMLIFLLSVAQHACGSSAIPAFLAPLLAETGVMFSENIMTMSVPISQAVSTLCISLVVEKAGRRTWLLWSCVGCGVPCLLWGCFYYLKNINSPLLSSIQWLPLFSVIIYMAMFSIGLGPIPLAVVCEMFPSDLISAAVTFVICSMNITAFIIVSAFPFVASAWGFQWCVWMFSFFSFVAAIFIYFFLPETKGKNIIEIQEMLKTYSIKKPSKIKKSVFLLK